jgi:hypothetical protein
VPAPKQLRCDERTGASQRAEDGYSHHLSRYRPVCFLH